MSNAAFKIPEMAQRENRADREKLGCSVCLDLLKDPVTIPCGHSYCMSCIRSYWDEEEQRESHSCPQCRQTFIPRPALVRNTVMADLVEDAKKAGLQAATHEGVTCDFCTEEKLKAIKSCLQCLVSYCEQHLQPHYEVAALKKHKLVEPSQKLQEIICSQHNEVMKIFCRTDQQCICYLCSMDEHRGHETVSAAAETSEKQRELRESQQSIERGIRERERSVKLLQQEICELRRRSSELEQLAHTQDPTQFLHSYTSLSRLREAADSPSCDPQRPTEDVTAAGPQRVLSEEWTITSLTATAVDDSQPTTRAEFLEHRCQITFNANTAHQSIVLGPGLQAKYKYTQGMRYHDHPDRFTSWPQVLSREGLTESSYWEVEWSGNVFIAAAYKGVSRSGRESAFGSNKVSWALECFCGGYEFRYNNCSTFISGPQASRIGVYVYYKKTKTRGPVVVDAPSLSFYSVSESSRTMTLLHTVRSSYTGPLLVGLGVYGVGAFAEICDVLR